MKNLKILPKHLFVAAYLIVIEQLVWGIAFTGKQAGLTDEIRKSIEKAFPGAVITHTEKEQWRGGKITEVELTAKDGTRYEVYISDSGVIQKVEVED